MARYCKLVHILIFKLCFNALYVLMAYQQKQSGGFRWDSKCRSISEQLSGCRVLHLLSNMNEPFTPDLLI